MTSEEAIQSIEDRAYAARITIAALCAEAKVHHASWSRAKGNRRIGVRLLSRLEGALDQIERARKTA
jgi:hypothetical protein